MMTGRDVISGDVFRRSTKMGPHEDPAFNLLAEHVVWVTEVTAGSVKAIVRSGPHYPAGHVLTIPRDRFTCEWFSKVVD